MSCLQVKWQRHTLILASVLQQSKLSKGRHEVGDAKLLITHRLERTSILSLSTLSMNHIVLQFLIESHLHWHCWLWPWDLSLNHDLAWDLLALNLALSTVSDDTSMASLLIDYHVSVFDQVYEYVFDKSCSTFLGFLSCLSDCARWRGWPP